ncbi:MAG: glycosyltransferase family 4 protein [Flavobacteriales bacterium]
MRILYYSPHPNLNFGAPSGPGTHMREMVHAFRVLGHEVELCILGGTEWQPGGSANSAVGGLKQRIKPLVPRILWHTMKDRNLQQFDARAAQELEAACERFAPDLIYERGYYLMTSGVEVAGERGIRHVLEINAPYPEEKVSMEGKSFYHARALRAERLQFERTDKLVVVSTALQNYYLERTDCPDKILVTPNAVRDPQVTPDLEGAARVRGQWGIAPDALVFGFVGSIFPYHGVDRLIAAFVTPKLQEAHLLIVGGGAWLDQLKAQAASGPAAGRIHFTGNVPHAQVPAHIAAMDVTVMAKSNWYGSPVKIFEYGVLGKPIVAPDVAPVRDVMQHGHTGWLVPDEAPALQTALETLAADAELRNRLGEAFRTQIARNHTWKRMAEQVLDPNAFGLKFP